jgi:quercetin dioxygenase-like cupin family protein
MRILAVPCVVFAGAAAVLAQVPDPVRCVPDSPERRGGTGCSIVAHKAVSVDRRETLYWHVDRFPSVTAAEAAATPSSVAAAAHGSAWLMTVEPQTSNHRGGTHVAVVGPLPLPRAAALMMQVMSAHFMPGQVSEPHTHSGPEAWFVVEGEQCLETPDRAIRVKAGETAVIEGGPAMRLVGTGTGPRRALVLILHDAAQPATTITRGAKLVSCS